MIQKNIKMQCSNQYSRWFKNYPECFKSLQNAQNILEFSSRFRNQNLGSNFATLNNHYLKLFKTLNINK